MLYSANSGHEECARLLLEARADIDFRNPVKRWRRVMGTQLEGSEVGEEGLASQDSADYSAVIVGVAQSGYGRHGATVVCIVLLGVVVVQHGL
jgi:hypothetical protein